MAYMTFLVLQLRCFSFLRGNILGTVGVATVGGSWRYPYSSHEFVVSSSSVPGSFALTRCVAIVGNVFN